MMYDVSIIYTYLSNTLMLFQVHFSNRQ